MTDMTVTSKRWLTVWITNDKTSNFWMETTILELVPHMQNLTCIVSGDDGAWQITQWTLTSGPTFSTSDDRVREGWPFNLSSVSMKMNVKTEYVSQADFSFHTATHSKEAPPCQISEPWLRKNSRNCMEKTSKMLPLSAPHIFTKLNSLHILSPKWPAVAEWRLWAPGFCSQTLQRFVQV